MNLMHQACRYSYRVRWSEQDDEFVATCDEFPSLSTLAFTIGGAFYSHIDLITATLEDMALNGETPPAPIPFASGTRERT